MTRRTPCVAKTAPALARIKPPRSLTFATPGCGSPWSDGCSVHDAALLSSPTELPDHPWQNLSQRNRCGVYRGAQRNGEERKMKLHGEVGLEASQAAAVPTPRRRDSCTYPQSDHPASEHLHRQLEAATDRPGRRRKDMVVEAALAHFINPQPSARIPARQSFEDLHAQFEFSGAQFTHNSRDGRTARAISPGDATSAQPQRREA